MQMHRHSSDAAGHQDFRWFSVSAHVRSYKLDNGQNVNFGIIIYTLLYIRT